MYEVHIDTSFIDQVWLQFTFVLGVMFAFCYVTSVDSLFFDPLSFSHIQENIKIAEMSRGYVLMGDFNAYFDNFSQQLLPEQNYRETTATFTYLTP